MLLLFMMMVTTAFTQPNLNDQANLTNRETQKLIAAKNSRYLQTSEQPRIVVITVNRLNKLTPKSLNKSKRTAYIVVGKKGNKKNVQLFSTMDLHSAFTAESRMNIIHAATNDLRSNNKKTFNRGLRFVFRACATKIDQRYQYSLDKYDLNKQEQNKIDHPNRVALPIALGIVVLISALVYFLRRIRRKNNRQNNA